MQETDPRKRFWDEKKRQTVGRLVRCLLFFVLLFSSMVIYNNVVRQVPYRYSRERFAGYYAEPKNSISVIGIGSSACNRYLDTLTLYDKFGITSYNLSTPLQPTMVASFLMNEAEKTQSPELYIVEVREFLKLYGDATTRTAYVITDGVNLSLDKWKLVCYLYPEWEKRIEGFFDIIKYHENWTGLTKKDFAFWDNNQLSPVKSWQALYRTYEAKEPVNKGKEPQPLPGNNEEVLRALLEECREKNRRVLFVLHPFSCKQKILRRLPALQEIIEEYGYEFLDLLNGNPCGIDYKTDMNDTNHVNINGCVKVTTYLGEYIQKNYGITATELTEENRRVWDKCAKNYRKQNEAYYRGEMEVKGSNDDFAL